MNEVCMAKVGVIVTVYNPCEEYFIACLNSIKNQTLDDIEVLLIDDGSEKRIADICDQYAQSDKRFKVWHKLNEGVSIASNFGIEHLTAEYFTFVDHDDKVDKQMCEKAYKVAMENDADIVIWNYVSFSSQFEKESYYIGPSEKKYSAEDAHTLRKMVLDPMSDDSQHISLLGANWGKLYKTRIVKKDTNIRFPEHIMGGEDAIFTLRMLKAMKTGCFINEHLYYYRQSESSFTKKYRKNMPQEEMALAKLYKKEFDGDYDERLFDKYYCNLLIVLMVNYIWNQGNEKNIREKKKEVKDWLKTKEICEALRAYRECGFGGKKMLFLFFANHGMVGMVMLLSYIFKITNREQRDV